MLVDQRWPMWGELQEFIGEDTTLITTGRVEEELPPEDAQPTGQRYNPDNDG